MARNFNEAPHGSMEPLTLEDRLLDAIGDRFVSADLGAHSDLASQYVGVDLGNKMYPHIATIVLAESITDLAYGKGELIHLSVPIEDPQDVWSSVDFLEPSNPDRFALILHLKDGRSRAFKVTGERVRPYRDLPRYGRSTRMVPPSYLDETYRKVRHYQLVSKKRLLIPPEETANPA